MQSAKIDPEMVKLAIQLVDRQTGRVLIRRTWRIRYETRLRAMLDAKLKGEGFSDQLEPEMDRTNVIDLMAALKKSLGSAAHREPLKATATEAEKPRVVAAKAKRGKLPTAEEMRRQPAFTLPIKGGAQKEQSPLAASAATPSTEPGRKTRSRQRA